MDDDVIDPTQFLAREDEDYSRDGDEPLSLDATEQSTAGDNPQILASLGLHSVNSGYGGMVRLLLLVLIFSSLNTFIFPVGQ